MCGTNKLRLSFPFKLPKTKEKSKDKEIIEIKDPETREPHPNLQPTKSAFKSMNSSSPGGSSERRGFKKHVRFTTQLDLTSVKDGGGSKHTLKSPLPSSRHYVYESG